MKRTLGRSGIEVSALGLGCWAIGGPWWYVGEDGMGEPSPSGWGQIDDKDSIRALHTAFDLGINFYDTADVYGCGHSEVVLGQAFADRRDKVVIATKFGKQFDETKKHYFGHKTSPELIRQACDASLRRLGSDYIDLYQFHWGDYDGDAGMVQDVLEELVTAGKIRFYGWSTDDIENAQAWIGGAHYVSVQHALHAVHRRGFDPAIINLCIDENLAGIIRSPLAMGILTGKFTTESTFASDDIRKDWDFKQEGLNSLLMKLEDIRAILTSRGRTLAQGALGWLWARSPMTIPIPGFKNIAQVKENVGAFEHGALSSNQLEQIDMILDRS